MILDKQFATFLKIGALNFTAGHIFIVLFSMTTLDNFFVVLYSHLCGLIFNFFSYKNVFNTSIFDNIEFKKIIFYIIFNLLHIGIFTVLLNILNPITNDRIISVLIICGPLNIISFLFYKFLFTK